MDNHAAPSAASSVSAPTLADIRANRDVSVYPLSKLAHAIAVLEKDLATTPKSLQSTIDDLTRKLERMRWITAPIRPLPTEILQHIFYAFCELPYHLAVCHESNPAPTAELLLSMVCIRWRNVAISTPGLWSNIKTRRDKQPSSADPKLCRLYLRRSFPYPLTIYIVEDDLKSVQIVDPTIRLLSDHSSRWHNVEIHADTCYQLHERPFNAIRGNLPLLNRLIWDVPHCYCGGTPPEPTDFFLNAPRLSILSIFDGSVQQYPWDQLRHLSIGRTTASKIVECVSKCSNLSTLCITDATFGPMTFDDDNVDSTSFSSPLSALKLKFRVQRNLIAATIILSHWSRVFPVLLQSFILPNLSSLTLELEGRAEEDQWSFDPFSSLFSRSSSHLTHLSLKDQIPIKEEELVDCLLQLPSLHFLQINQKSSRHKEEKDPNNWFTFDFLNQALTCPSGGPSVTTQEGKRLDINYPLLPELSRIDFVFCAHEQHTINNALFTEMIRFRTTGETKDQTQISITHLTSVQLKLHGKRMDGVQLDALKKITGASGTQLMIDDNPFVDE